VAVLTPATVSELMDYLRSDKALEIDRDTLAHTSIPLGTAGEIDAAAFAKVGFDSSEAREVRDLYEVEPGSRFNLSEPESQRFAALRREFQSKDCEKDPRCADVVVSTLRQVLQDRLAAYLDRGLAGIAPYARRGGQQTDPAGELRRATMAAQPLAREYPQIFAAFLDYPKGDQSSMENRFLLLKQTVQDRPTFILSHRVSCLVGGIALAAERQIYVGHSYNSLQILLGLIPMEGKTLVIYLNRTSSDQVAGAMTKTRHSVGRKMMERDIRGQFEDTLARLGHPPAR
jgi:hypothetical protein